MIGCRRGLLPMLRHEYVAYGWRQKTSLPYPRESRYVWAVRFLLLCGILLGTGCRSFVRPEIEDVVQSRQLSLSGMHAMHRGEWQEAESMFTRAIETSATNQRARCCYAEALWRRGATQEAIVQMQESVRLSGGDPALRVRLGEMHLAERELDAAARQATEAIRQNPRLPSSWALRGDVLAQRNQPEAALASYHRALSYQPHFPRVQLATAEIHRQLHQPQRALVALHALEDAYRPSEVPGNVVAMRGLAYKDLGRYHDASVSLAQAVNLGVVNVDLMYQLGEAQMLAGRPHDARLTILQTLRADPEHAPSHQLLSRLDLGDVQVVAQRDQGMPQR
ncbi:MAG: hypothetical protein CL681_28715 [Blastopirellula sp.]|nr:hypothetical protein [Blastopirellula sp.]